MKLKEAINIEDLRQIAKSVVPRVVIEILEGASEDEISYHRSTEDFRNIRLLPKVLRGVENREISTTLFGRTYAAPFGIAPTGTIGVLRKNIELVLARSAKAADIPCIVSGASVLEHERIAAEAPGYIWSQVYAATDPKITEDLVRRAESFGSEALVWTVSQPVASKNDRLIHSGYGIPPRLKLGAKLEALRHPTWLREYLSGGMVGVGHWQRYAPPNANINEVYRFYMSQRNAMQTWRELEALRRMWKGPLVVKGILRPDDAVTAAECGADGIIVSTHGGFALDRAASSIQMLPHVVDAVGDKATVMLDTGVRRGSDVVTALALGAKFVFIGRATLYGATAGLDEGAKLAIDILKDETKRTMGLLGCSSVAELSRDLVHGHDGGD